MTTDRTDLATVIRDLLTIAKVAMPDDLFAIDPRVIRAQELLASLEHPRSSSTVLGIPPVSRGNRKPPYKADAD